MFWTIIFSLLIGVVFFLGCAFILRPRSETLSQRILGTSVMEDPGSGAKRGFLVIHAIGWAICSFAIVWFAKKFGSHVYLVACAIVFVFACYLLVHEYWFKGNHYAVRVFPDGNKLFAGFICFAVAIGILAFPIARYTLEAVWEREAVEMFVEEEDLWQILVKEGSTSLSEADVASSLMNKTDFRRSVAEEYVSENPEKSVEVVMAKIEEDGEYREGVARWYSSKYSFDDVSERIKEDEEYRKTLAEGHVSKDLARYTDVGKDPWRNFEANFPKACAFMAIFLMLFVWWNDGKYRPKDLVKVVALIGAVAITLVILFSGVNFNEPSQVDTESTVALEAATEPETKSTETEPVVGDTRDPRFIQEEVSHEKYRLCFDFYDRMIKNARENLRVELIPEDTTATILSIAGHNAELLAIYAQGLGLYPDSSQYKELLNSDGTYLSEKGIALYYQLEGALSVCKVDRTWAPHDGTNTGYDGGFVRDFQSGISGNSMATGYMTPSGDVFYVMDRCGNFVYPDPPKDIPEGNTDEPKKDKTEGVQGNLVAPGDNPGPGPSTNNGVGAQTSSADEPSKSSSTQTYTEYKEEVEKTNEAQKPAQETQKQSGDSNQPTTTESSANVDNNGATGNGNGSADDPASTQPPQEKEEDNQPISTQPGGALGDPND